MTNARTTIPTIMLVALCLVAGMPAAATAQDAFLRAKDLYESAEYEQALQILSTLKDKGNSEADAYQVFCLVALGRKDEARGAVQALVRKDPFFRPADAQVSPRLRSFFDDIRTPLLPEVARGSYTRAKAAYDRKDFASARVEFARVITLLDEVNPTDQGAKDLRMLAVGFRELTETALKAAARGPESSPTTAAPTPAPVSFGEGDAGVIRPVSLSRQMPVWAPTGIEQQMTFTGTIEVLVSESGTVLSAAMIKPVHTRYDGLLLEAAKAWTFKPATKNGVRVKYRYQLTVTLEKPKVER